MWWYARMCYVLKLGCLKTEWPVKIERVSAFAPSRMSTETDQFTTRVGIFRGLSGGQYLEI
jgi:hypothetical protein